MFTAFDGRFIGTERDLGDVFGTAEWSVVILQTAAPLARFLGKVQLGTVLFTLAFIVLITLVVGLFFVANIRKPMRVICQSIAAISQGNLDIASARAIGNDKDLLAAVQLEVAEEVQIIATGYQTRMELNQVVVTDGQGKIIARGGDAQATIDATVLSKPFGVIEQQGRYQAFSHHPLAGPQGHRPEAKR